MHITNESIRLLNSMLWNRTISKENKHRIYSNIVKSIVTYNSKVWPLKEKNNKIIGGWIESGTKGSDRL